MSNREDELQERLEQLESGQNLADCVAGLPPEEAELVHLAAELQTAAYPVFNVEKEAIHKTNLEKMVIRQRQDIPLTVNPQEWFMEIFNNLKQKFFALPQPAQMGLGAGLTVALLVLFVWAFRGGEETPVVENGQPEPTAAFEPDDNKSEEDIVESDSSETVAVPAQVQTIALLPADPRVSPSGLPANPRTVVLSGLAGVVEVQAAGETAWAMAGGAQILSSGDRIRTQAQSTARLTFYDGSQVTLKPESELSLDEVNALLDQPRTIVMTQWQGESEHQVTSRPEVDADGKPLSTYQVKTADGGTTSALGTAFTVTITPDLLSRVWVSEGQVAVVNLDVTVIVLAGQITTWLPNQPPLDPVFQIFGQGAVTVISDTWTIGSQQFVVDENTIIVGEPEVGDWVSVIGRLVDEVKYADYIILVRPATNENNFSFTGSVESIDEAEWVISGQTVVISDNTTINGEIVVSDTVRVEGVILEDGTLVAETITLQELSQQGFEFTGVVQSVALSDTLWTIAGVPISVTSETVITAEGDTIAVGDLVHVTGYITADGAWVAETITLVTDPTANGFVFTGDVQSMEPWVVAGIVLTTSEVTIIAPNIEVGTQVQVTGIILEDGSWLATEIIPLTEEEGCMVVVGLVQGIDPWVINGLPVVVGEESEIGEGIEIGDLVFVTICQDEDGEWVIISITPLTPPMGLGCFTFSTIVLGSTATQLTTPYGPFTITPEFNFDPADVGEGTIVLVVLCIDEDGTIILHSIIIIFWVEPIVIIVPTIPAPPPSNTTICHKPGTNAQQTMTVSESALGGHLGHGDTIGACP